MPGPTSANSSFGFQTDASSPLKGDGSGVYRVHVVGNSGTGKAGISGLGFLRKMFHGHRVHCLQSTLAKELGAILGVPVVHLDQLFWNPGWFETPRSEFQARVSAALEAEDCRRGWVVDGNYNRRLDGRLDGATDIIWLDPPFLLYFPHLIKRTFLRIIRRGEQCAPGCDERISETLFSRSSILWWAITNHVPVRRRQIELMKTGGVQVGGNIRRIGGWGREVDKWKKAVVEMVKAE